MWLATYNWCWIFFYHWYLSAKYTLQLIYFHVFINPYLFLSSDIVLSTKSINCWLKSDCICVLQMWSQITTSTLTSFFSLSFSFFSPPPSTFSLFFSSSFFHRWEKWVQAHKIQKADLSLLQIHYWTSTFVHSVFKINQGSGAFLFLFQLFFYLRPDIQNKQRHT